MESLRPKALPTNFTRFTQIPAQKMKYKYTHAGIVPQHKYLFAGFSPRGHGFAPALSMWDLWWAKWHSGRCFLPGYFACPCQYHSNDSPYSFMYYLGDEHEAS